MGSAELDTNKKQLIIHSHFVIYGEAADEQLTGQIQDETETLWNEPAATIMINNIPTLVRFRITAELEPHISDLQIYQNTDPKNNYFRVEEYAIGNISFVDGVGCNSGFFKLENLYKGSTTAAHEYGHTLGLDHPKVLDIRGHGVPGIMYPRGTIVDPQYQYDPTKPPGVTGGTMHPMYRKVKVEDVQQLRLHKLRFQNNRSIVGEFTNVYHSPHQENLS
jgi:hypothetical protein